MDYRYIRLQVHEGYLEVYDSYYNKLWFKLMVDEPHEWKQIFEWMKMEEINRMVVEMYVTEDKRQKELRELFDKSSQDLKILYRDRRKEREQFQRKNIRSNLEIQDSYLYERTKDRKLKAVVLFRVT